MSDPEVFRAFDLAAEALEAVVKNGVPTDEARGFHRIVAAAAYHLGRFSARAYSLLNQALEAQNLAIIEEALALVILRRLDALQTFVLEHISADVNSDDSMIQRLENADEAFDIDNALIVTLSENYLRALAAFLFAIRTSDAFATMNLSRERLLQGGIAEIIFECETFRRRELPDNWESQGLADQAQYMLFLDRQLR